jgi:curved DNA-binding protein
LAGSVTVKVPAGSRGGGKLRLKGCGLPGTPPGDQYLHLNIVVPATASAPVQELYRELQK